MINKYGIFGLMLILVVQLILVFKIELFANYYFPFIWFGYILFIDALVFKLKNSSLISNHFKQFCMMLILSSIFWWIFEWINTLEVNSWHYIGSPMGKWTTLLFKTISFSTVLPAVWETFELIIVIHLFDKSQINTQYTVTTPILYSMMLVGIICFLLPYFWPMLGFPLIWLGFFLILDPINYMHKEDSIINYVKNGKLNVPLSLMLAGLICGFFWEFWNYWAPVKWIYTIPYVGFLKIFEMPLLGYFGYLFFAWELYAMYHFCMLIWKKFDRQTQ